MKTSYNLSQISLQKLHFQFLVFNSWFILNAQVWKLGDVVGWQWWQ
jgi:hypothetical protein